MANNERLCKQCVTELRKDLCSVDINFEKEIEIFYQVQESSVDLKGIRTGCLTAAEDNDCQDMELENDACISSHCTAPGQETVLLNSIQTKKTEIDSTNKCIIEAYKKVANSRTQTQILSLIVNNFTKSELQNMIPGVTVSRVDAARKHAMVTGPGNILNPPKIYRMKLTRPKIAHFIDYILNPLYSSIVGFGQTVLKLSTNETLTIPKVVRNLIHARIINSYQTYCLETGFSSFSKASLYYVYRILKVCNASKQKALQGLDNTSAAGMGAIDNLTKVVTKLEAYGLRHEDVNKLKEMLQLVNQFLKFEYKLHLRKNDQCADHCSPFALSDSVDHNFATKCNHSHTQSCEKCKLVDSCVNIVEKAFSNLDIPKTLSDEISYELENGARNVLEWKRHLLRTVHQNGARNDVLSDLKDNQGLLIMDWVSVNQEVEPKIRTKIPGISSFNNFTSLDDGIIVKKVYNVGSGKKIGNGTLTDKNLEVERVYNLKVNYPFPGAHEVGTVSLNQHHVDENTTNESVANEVSGTVGNDHNAETDSFFSCPDPSCQKIFAKCFNLERHLAIGNHSYLTNSCTSMDEAALSTFTTDTELIINSDSEDRIGWAIKNKRKSTRFSLQVKDYLIQICEACDKTGKRPDCGSLSEEIKKASNENGEKLFKKEERLSSTQIKGFVAFYLSRKSKSSDHDTTPPPSKKQSVSQNECVLEEFRMEDDEKLSEIVTALETDDYNENMNNMVDNVFLAINIQS
ncbi:unnamed protein product [Mytilus coruscus]|uniref:C2H2-type domain-containing protein n=1 Tax=Mytilus coruscus TaxID=42192 RepID=A0A6J8E9B9_MYTCO|nr:unnamed protein product [Mytilus coruscus]